MTTLQGFDYCWVWVCHGGGMALLIWADECVSQNVKLFLYMCQLLSYRNSKCLNRAFWLRGDIRYILFETLRRTERITDRGSDEMRYYIRQDRLRARERESALFQCSLRSKHFVKRLFLSERILFFFNNIHTEKIFYSLLFVWLSHCSTSTPTKQIRCQTSHIFLWRREH